jgi:beta-galactosidase
MIYYGGDYNPEQYPEHVWDEDIRLMKKAGVTMVTIAVFSWAKIEPEHGVFEFDWLDKVIEKLQNAGIFIDLATATASPPPWLAHTYVDVFPVDEHGNRFVYGSRQTYCPNSPSYKKHAAKLCEKMVARYKDLSNLRLWHINNEFACNTPMCFCENCAAEFRGWLLERYGGVEGVNEAWGTSFWSQQYGSLDEILPPAATTAQKNPGQVLDYQRFMSDSFLNLYKMERDIIRSSDSGIPITTNLLPDFKPLDYFTWAPEMDIISWDNYPNPAPGNLFTEPGFMHDLARGLKEQPYLLMEQAANQVNWRPVNSAKPPGIMRLHSYQALAHGADSIMFFQMRQSRKGSEKFHSAMIPYNGNEKNRSFRECVQLGRELEKLAEIQGSRIHSDIAIMFDYNSWWAMEYQPGTSNRVHYLEQVKQWYYHFVQAGFSVDIVPQGRCLDDYSILLAPTLYLLHPGGEDSIKKFVKKGGSFLGGFFTAIVDETDGLIEDGALGPLREVFGIRIDEYNALESQERISFVYEGQSFESNIWTESLIADSAECIAEYSSSFLKGQPAITKNSYGQGTAWYVSNDLPKEVRERIVHSLLKEQGLKPSFQQFKDLEHTRRIKERAEYLFFLNHSEADHPLEFNQSYFNMLDEEAGKRFILKRNDVLILKREL